MKRFCRINKHIILMVLPAAILCALFFCGMLIPDTAIAGSYLHASQPPSFAHPFGTDALGRDLLLRTLKGIAVSMTIGFAASGISAVIAIFVGLAASFGMKSLDAVINWLIDLVMSVPHTILIILISCAAGRGLKGLLIGIAATHWCSLARLIRGEVMQLRTQQYITISRKLGKSGAWIFRHHFLPALLPQLIVGLILNLPHAVLHEASVSFLGFGLPPEQPAVGIMLSESMRYLSAGMWWQAVFPGAMLIFTVLLTDRLGNQLRRMTEPGSM